MIKKILPYGLLSYSLSILILALYLSHLPFDTGPPVIKNEQVRVAKSKAVSPPAAPPPINNATIHNRRHTQKHENIHPTFSYDTREPEAYEARPIPNFSKFKVIQKKKSAFIDFFSAIIKEQNTLQLKRREQLKAIKDLYYENSVLSQTAQDILQGLSDKYRIPEDMKGKEALNELDARINIIPSSLVLAQAATESAWGTSRFAKQANNFFGQWCFTTGCGIVPSRRVETAKHEIAKFKSAESSVRAYFKNLNTYRTYKDFRDIRLHMSKKGEPLKGLDLVEGLKYYSERGDEYVHDLKNIIRFNKLNEIPHE